MLQYAILFLVGLIAAHYALSFANVSTDATKAKKAVGG